MSVYKDTNKPKKDSKYSQGYFVPENKDKYVGDITKIIYRSSWEYKFCKYCDLTEAIEKWSSEPFPIKYYDPINKKKRSYYVDFYIKLKLVNNEYKDYLVEVKPKSKLTPPKQNFQRSTLKKVKEFNYLLEEYIINKAKKEAAEEFAKTINYSYMIVTEEFLTSQKFKK